MSGPSPNPRAVALQLFRAVMQHKQAFDLALAQNDRLAQLEPRDRAFARLLAASLLRRLGQIDALIDHCLERPLKARYRDTRDLLRLGTLQLVFLETPPHAAVSTTLALAEDPRTAGQKGLINALLRRLATEGAALAAQQDAPRLNTPAWLWKTWVHAYGPIAAHGIAAASLTEPPLDLTVKDDPESWAERLRAQVLFGQTLRLAKAEGDIVRLAGFESGAWWVQDAAAALPAQLLGDLRGKTVLDICAAPGGKTAQLAAAGGRVTAVERSPARVLRLKENLQRLRLSAETVTADALVWRPTASADAILLDVPCSATGTLRRHPDIAHLKGPADVTKLASFQDRLLKTSLEMVKPGGLIVYATCSLQPEEGPERIAALLAGNAPVARVPVTAEEVYGRSEFITADGDLRTLPSHLAEEGGIDGFYACRLRKL